MPKRHLLVADPLKCTGCRICQLVCSYTKEKVFNPAKARLHLNRVEPLGLDVITACHQCARPTCAEACPVEAIVRDERGIMTADPNKCFGCGLCVEGCPLGVLHLHPDSNIPLFCDQCGECVLHCPVKTLRIAKIDDLAGEKRVASVKRTYMRHD